MNTALPTIRRLTPADALLYRDLRLEALRLYESLGFAAYGLERNALKQGGRDCDDVLMAKDLRPPPIEEAP